MVEVTQVLYWVAGALLLIAAFVALVRLMLGPTVLDRTVAADLVTSVAIGITALIVVWWSRFDLRALLVLFALTGFFSSVAISRFVGRETHRDRKIISRDEARLLENQGEPESPDGETMIDEDVESL